MYNKLCSFSSLEVSFIDYLKNDKIKVVSFDIFETLLYRDVETPSDIFQRVGNNKIVKDIFDSASLFKKYRILAEQNARKYKKKDDIKLIDIYNYLPLCENQKLEIMSIEISEEYTSLYVNKQIEKWINLCIQYNKKVILISDIYLSKHTLEVFLSKYLTNFNSISHLFVSSEIGKAKYTSNLYRYVKSEMNYNFDEQLHIGDNKLSDVEVPKKLGIHSLYYNCTNEVYDVEKLEKKYLQHNFPQYNNLRKQSSILNPYEDKEESFYYNLGARIYGPLLYGFVNWISNICLKYNITQVNFLMREGRIFKKCLEYVNSKLEINLIYASRHSTYLASLDILDIFEIIKNPDILSSKSEFKNMKISDFFELLNIEIKNTKLSTMGNTMFGKLKDSNVIKLVHSILEDNIEQIKININKEKSKIKKYLTELGVKKDSIILDFGPNGTVLRRLYNLTDNMSKYLGLFYSGNDFIPFLKCKMFSFFFSNEDDLSFVNSLSRSCAATEVLFNGMEYTTVGYEDGKKIIPKLKKETSFSIKNLEAFDKGVKSFICISEKHMKNKDVFLNNRNLSLLSRLISVPTLQEAKYIGKLQFGIGAGRNNKNNTIVDIKRQDDYFDKNFYDNHINIKNYKQEHFEWPEGYITQKDSLYIQKRKALLDSASVLLSVDSIVEVIRKEKFDKVSIYGAGEFFINLLKKLNFMNIVISSVMDSKANNKRFSVCNFNIKTMSESLSSNMVVIIASDRFSEEIFLQIESHCVNKNINNITIIDCVKGIRIIN